MADAINLSGMLGSVKATTLGKAKPNLELKEVAQPATQTHYFRMENGEAKIPRVRKSSNVWPEWFEALKAPEVAYFFVQDDGKGLPVQYNEEKELFVDEEGNEYTGDNVVEMGKPDSKTLEGSPEAMQALQNAITRFNTKTGKKLAIRFVKDVREQGGNGKTITAVREVYRVR